MRGSSESSSRIRLAKTARSSSSPRMKNRCSGEARRIQRADGRVNEGGVSARWNMNQQESSQRNHGRRHVPAGHAVIRDTSPERPIPAQTTNELACLSQASTEGVRPSRTPDERPKDDAATVFEGDGLRPSPWQTARFQRCAPNSRQPSGIGMHALAWQSLERL